MASRNKRDAFFSSTSTDESPSITSSYISRRNPELSSFSSKYDSNSIYNGAGALPNVSNLLSTETPDLDTIVGFSSLLNQIQRNALRRGFDFNLMVVGASGLGKSTFINSLFLSEVYNANHPGPSKRPTKTSSPEAVRYILKENGVQLRLTVIDTPGFGDAVDNSNCWKPVLDYVEARFSEHMRNEQRVHRPLDARDQRVHACLYFIQPTGHGLKQLDIEFMRHLHDKVNIIPVIGKADTLTPEECKAFKQTIHNELLQHKITTYDFPEEIISLIGAETKQVESRRLRDRQPFAVIGSNSLVPATTGGGRGSRGRTYPWGTVEVDNLEHNDFIALRTLLLNVHMKDLIETTERLHYEMFRQQRLSQIAEQSNFAKDPLAQLEEEQATFEAKMRKSEAEMEQVFEQKVREKMAKLKELEVSNQRRADQMQKQLQAEEAELEERWKAFVAERQAWESTMGANDSPQGSQATLPTNLEKPKDAKKKKGIFSS